jgi:hypothetical protein
MRDLCLTLAAAGIFRARWTEQINKEWVGKLLLNNPGMEMIV